MKGKDIITHAMRAEMPDMETLRQNCIQQATQIAASKRSLWVRSFAPVAACTVLLVAILVALPHLQNPTSINGYNNGGYIESEIIATDNRYDEYVIAPTQQPSIERHVPQYSENLLPPEFIGLPVVNHCLPQENPMASRMGVGSLLDILGTPGRAVEYWANNPVQAVAFVRVIEAVQEDYTLISTVEVLRTVWSRGRELPKRITLLQDSGAIMCCTPYGEMMREGGVFLLPLWYYEGTGDSWRMEGWFNWTYRDVLFEVDDNGLVWSRSNKNGFNRFDGRHTSVLTNAILGIINGDENIGRDIAHTWFGDAADDGVLAIVSITSSDSVLLFPDSPGQELWQNTYNMRPVEVLSTPTPYGLKRGGWFEQQQRWRDNWQVSENWWQDWSQDSAIMVVNTAFARGIHEVGGQYLVFITPSYGNWSAPFTLYSESMARINADGTVTPISSEGNIWNVFDGFDGYTVERLAELAYLANTWHEVSSDY